MDLEWVEVGLADLMVILAWAVQEPGQVVRDREVAGRIWAADRGVADHAMEDQVAALVAGAVVHGGAVARFTASLGAADGDL